MVEGGGWLGLRVGERGNVGGGVELLHDGGVQGRPHGVVVLEGVAVIEEHGVPEDEGSDRVGGSDAGAVQVGARELHGSEAGGAAAGPGAAVCCVHCRSAAV